MDPSSGASDPLAGSTWSRPETVDGFVKSPPNARLIELASKSSQRSFSLGRRLLDLGCGAGRNALPLARVGWHVVGTDLSLPMVRAAADRARMETLEGRVQLILAPMDAIPLQNGSVDFLVAHGIWNLARTGAQFRQSVAEAGRVAKPGAPLFVFTFSRNTLPADVEPVPAENFVFTQFSGQPQCFLTETQLVDELASEGFRLEPDESLRELNLPRRTELGRPTAPVIYEGVWRRR